MLPATISYQLMTRDVDRTRTQIAERPDVAREVAYYRENISNISSLDEFMADDRLFRFAANAYGLGDMAYAKAFLRKVLEEGIDSRDSFANRLTDRRYKEFATVFNFERYGSTTTAFTRTQQGTIDRYIQQELEVSAGQSNEAVRLALYFERRSADISSAYELLGDPALLRVAQVLSGLPSNSSAMDLDKQAAQISSRINFDDLKDPDSLRQLMERFTALWEAQNPTASAAAPSILVQPGPIGISQDLLTSIQSLEFKR